MGNLGFQEIMLIFIIALIVFGPKKLPELGKAIGKGLAEFRRASNELRNTWEEEVRMEELKKLEKMTDLHDDYSRPSSTGSSGYSTASPDPTYSSSSGSSGTEVAPHESEVGHPTTVEAVKPAVAEPSKPTTNEPGKA